VNSWAILAQTATVVLAVDQAAKLLVHRVASLRVIEGQLWMRRASYRHPNMLWLWVLPAAVLVVVTAWIPSSSIFAGLMIGGSLSNAVEGSLRGSVTDYFRPPFWPAFNIADIALTVGAIGIAVELLRTVGELSR
jgi:lipoprotein signal peptidase